MHRQQASCPVSEGLLGCFQAWPASSALLSLLEAQVPGTPLCALASFARPQKPHSGGRCLVGRYSCPGVLAPVISREGQCLRGQHVPQLASKNILRRVWA